MTDAQTLRTILAAHKPASLAEQMTLIHTSVMLRNGADPTQVLAHLEAQRDSVREWAAFEHEHGVSALFEQIREKAREMHRREAAELTATVNDQTDNDPAQAAALLELGIRHVSGVSTAAHARHSLLRRVRIVRLRRGSSPGPLPRLAPRSLGRRGPWRSRCLTGRARRQR